MAKGSQFWGSASGKLGEQVLYRAGGEQRARAYVKNIKNPKTIAQMRNRIVMGNLVAVFDALRPIIRNSFTNRATNQSGWNAFVKANKKIDTPIIDPAFNGTGISVPYNMLVSKGNVQTPPIARFLLEEDSYEYGIPFDKPISDGEYQGIGALNANNFKDMLQMLNLPETAKMTVISATFEDEGFELQYVTVDSASISALSKLNLTFQVKESNNADGGLYLKLSADNPSLMLGVIFSYSDGEGKLQVSTSRITLMSTTLDYVESYLPGGEIYERVLEKAVAASANVLATK